MPVLQMTARRKGLIHGLIAGLALLGCQTPGAAKTAAVDSGATGQAVRAADSVFAAAAAAADLEAGVAAFTRDGIMFPPEQPPVIGRAAIREYMRQSFATPNFSVSWTTDTVVVSANGDMAYTFSRSRYTFPGRSGAAGAVDTAYGKGVNVWRREADGRWRVVADIWNGAPVLPPVHPVGSS
jgi:uncharacterized protein (TIGR02246 family)